MTAASLAPALLAAMALVAFAAPTAHAASLTVTVVAADGQPAPNVVVQAMPTASAPARPASTVVIAQKDIRFVPWVTAVPVGTTVRFSNQDTFDHHVRSLPGGPLGNVPPAKEFELRLPGAKGDVVSSAEIRMDHAGVVALGCHIHGSMRGHLFIASTPFVAVTDASGHAVIDGLPDGEATVKAWHPEQLGDQADAKVVAGAKAGPATASFTLNFTPRRRRGG